MNQTEKDITEKQQTILMMDREIGLQMEILIPKMRKVSGTIINSRDVKEKSPFRNVLECCNVEPGSGIEVTKNYIRYQLGRGKKHGRDQESYVA